MLKCQQFDDSDSKKKVPRIYKHLQIDKNDNKKQDLDKYENEINRYISFSPAFLFSPPQKELNRPSDLDKGTKSLTHLVYISKIVSQKITNFTSKFPGRECLKPKKKNLYKLL